MSNINFLKPNRENLNLFLIFGSLFFALGLIDFCLNNFYETNITGFLPSFVSFFTPLIFGMIGLHLVRIEFSGIKILDDLNKNINTSNFTSGIKNYYSTYYKSIFKLNKKFIFSSSYCLPRFSISFCRYCNDANR